MPWEWTAPLATGVVGLGGVIGTYLAGRRQAKSAIEATEIQAQRVNREAREERAQRRLEQAYADLNDGLGNLLQWTRQHSGHFTAQPGKGDARFRREDLSLAERGQLYWSSSVRSEWEQFVLRLRFAELSLRLAGDGDDASEFAASAKRAFSHAEARAAHLRNQMSYELRGLAGDSDETPPNVEEIVSDGPDTGQHDGLRDDVG